MTINIPHYTEEISVTFYQVDDNLTFASQNVGEQLRNTAYSVSDRLNDTDAVSIHTRRNATPQNGVEWKTVFGTDGRRGSSRCYPIDSQDKAMLMKYGGQEYVRYNSHCDPDLKPFALAEVKISDMTESRVNNFRSAKQKLLQSDLAKEKDLHSIADVDRYCRENSLTLHESTDGVTVLLVPRDVHEFARHAGGVSEHKTANAQDKRGFLDQIRVWQKGTRIKINQSVVSAEDSFNEAMEELRDSAPAFVGQAGATVRMITENDIHQAGVKAATDAAIFAGTMAVARNAYAVLQKEKDTGEAIEDILYSTAASAASAYAMGVLKAGIDTALQHSVSVDGVGAIATGVVQISKHLIDYASGEIDEEQLKESVCETGAYLIAGYIGGNVGAFIGGSIGTVIGSAIPFLGNAIGAQAGAMIGRMVGEIVATTVCAEVISALQYGKAYEKQSAKIRALCAHAEREMRASQQRLREMIHDKNYELLLACDEGFRLIAKAVEINDMSLLKGGILRIGSPFGIDESYLSEGEVTADSLFSDSETIISFY